MPPVESEEQKQSEVGTQEPQMEGAVQEEGLG